MTLEEALNIMGTCMIAICTKSPGHESASYYVFNAILEEWMDGNIDIEENSIVDIYIKKHGMNIFKQAARTIANKIKVYGDVE